MDGRLTSLLEADPGPEPFVRRALGLLEASFRELALVALADWQRTRVASSELFQATASLQRPSWGSWNGLLLALRQARKEALRTAPPETRARIERAELLSRALALLDETVPGETAKELEPLGELVRVRVGSKLKTSALLGLPISLRNRVAHDSPTEESWWRDAARALRPLVAFHAGKEPCRIADPATLGEPWFLAVEGSPWAFNGLGHDDAAMYVSPTGVTRAAPERTQAVLLAFQELLGKADARERDVKRLLARLAPEEIQGVVLGDWLLGKPRGAGGFATVHVGRQLSTGRKVALKVLHDGLPEEARARFQQEAAFLSRFDHKNVVRVLGHGEETWTPPRLPILANEEWWKEFSRSAPVKTFLALEWIEGETLEDVIRRGPEGAPARETIAAWFAQAASALAAVHGAGLIHRDVKPSNLMVTVDGTVKLMDFGIARSQGENRTLATSTGVSLGTPAYMSPEQIRAADAESGVGPATDVYSLCATFYELFTGRRLFDHDRESAKTVETRKLEGSRPERPSVLAPGIGWELDTILLGGLEPEVSDRYASAVHLERDLARFLNDEPIEYRRPSLLRRLRLGYRRNRTVANLVAGFVAIAVLATTFYVRSLIAKEKRAVEAEAVARVQRDLAQVKEKRAVEAEAVAQVQRDEARVQRDAALVAALEAKASLAEADLGRLWEYRAESTARDDGVVDHAATVFSGAIALLRAAPDGARLSAADRGKLGVARGTLASVLSSARTVADFASASAETRLRLGTTHSFTCVALSPDKRTIAAGSEDGVIALWERESGRLERFLVDEGGVRAISFSRRGDRLVSATGLRSVSVWDRATGRLLRAIELGEPANDCAFACDDQVVVAWGPKGYWVVDPATGDGERRAASPEETWGEGAVSPDGRTFALVRDTTITLHGLPDGDSLELEGATKPIRCCAFSRDGERVLAGSGDDGEDERLRVWDARTGELRASIEHEGPVLACVAFRGTLATVVGPGDGRKVREGAPADPGHIEVRDATTGVLSSRIELPRFAAAFCRENGQLNPRTVAFAGDFSSLVLAAGDVGVLACPSGRLLRAPAVGVARVVACAVAPDGAELLAGTCAGELLLYDRASGELLRRIAAHEADVRSVAFSRDGGLILSGSDDGTARAFDRATGSLVRVLDGKGGAVAAVAFSPDGGQILLGSTDGKVRLWDTATGALARTFEGHGGEVTACAFSADGETVLSASLDRTVRAWDRRTGEVRQTFAHSQGVVAMAVSVQGEVVTIAGSGKGTATTRYWDLASGKLLRSFEGRSAGAGPVTVAFSPDGVSILAAEEALSLRDAGTGRVEEECRASEEGWDRPECGAFTPDGAELVRGGSKLTVRTRGRSGTVFSGRHRLDAAKEPTGRVNACVYSPAGDVVLTCGLDGTARLWDARSRRLLRVIDPGRGSVDACAFSPDGTEVLLGTQSGHVEVRDRATGELRLELEAKGGPVASVAFSPDGREILVMNAATVSFSVLGGKRITIDEKLDSAVRIFERASGKRLHLLDEIGRWASAAFSPDGKEVGGCGEETYFWDRASGRRLRGFDERGSFLLYSGGEVLVVASTGRLEVRDPSTWRVVRAFEEHVSHVVAVTASRDGSLVGTAVKGGLVRVWDRSSGRILESFQRPGGPLDASSVAFSPDGRELVAGYTDGSIVAWRVRPGTGAWSPEPARAEPEAPGALALEEDRSGAEVATPGRLAERGLRLLLGGAPSSGRAYLRAAAEAGDARAATRLAWALERGLGGRRDAAEAERWREAARARGDLLARGETEAAAASGDPLALALVALARKDEQGLAAAAARNEPDALLALVETRPREAARLLERACALEDPRALVWHGDLFIIADPEAAAADYLRAAPSGDPAALAGLERVARIFEQGAPGILADPRRAAELRARIPPR